MVAVHERPAHSKIAAVQSSNPIIASRLHRGIE
jgi:hypothetical protein